MVTLSTSELLRLDIQTRLKIIDELWESVINDLNDPDKQSSLPISDATRALLDERMREYRADPAAALRWDEVHERLLKMLQ